MKTMYEFGKSLMTTEELYHEIDRLASDVSPYEFGLPMTEGKKQIIQVIDNFTDAKLNPVISDLREQLRLMTLDRDNFKAVSKKNQTKFKRTERKLRKVLEEL